MPEENDVVMVVVTGVSTKGKIKDDGERPSESDQEKTPRSESDDSE